MSKKHKKRRHTTKTLAIRGVLFNWVGRGCSFVITFVATPVILGALGNEAYGLWAIVSSVGSYYALADLGMHAACIKYISQYQATDDRDGLTRMVTTAMTAYTIMALALLVIAIPVTWLFPYVFEFQHESIAAVRWAVFLTGVSIAVRLQAQVFAAALRAHKRFDIDNLISVVSQLSQAGLTIWAVVAGYGLIGMAWVQLGTTAATRVAQVWCASRLMHGIPLRIGAFDRDAFKLLFRFSALQIVRNGLGKVNGSTGPFLIGYFLGPAMVPFFTIANSLIGKTHSLTQAVSSVVMPVASELDAQNRTAALVEMMVLVPRVLVAIGLTMAVIFVVMGRQLIDLWLGVGYSEQVYPVLCVLSAYLVLSSVGGGLANMLTGTGQLALVTKLKLYGTLVTFVLGAVLVNLVGVIGIAWGMLVQSVLVNVFLYPLAACRMYEYSWWQYQRGTLLRPLVTLGVTIPTALILVYSFPPGRTLYWLAEACCVAGIGAGVSFFVCLNPELRQTVLSTIPIHKALRIRPALATPAQDQN